ncbi:MAG: lipoyl synthase [Anaerolineae bacterium]
MKNLNSVSHDAPRFSDAQRKPEWLRVRMPSGETYQKVRQLMRSKALHTVCEEAMCPNIGECWGRGTATFLLLGDICTRSCAFCNIRTGRPDPLDEEEPLRVAQAVKAMNLKHAVLTSVNRDELPDGGAHIFARSIELIHAMVPGCTVEVLIPDFKGSHVALQIVMDARPEVLNHNVETVPRLYRTVRPQAIYERSLRVLLMAKEMAPQTTTKSGIMVGLGETWEEVIQVMRDLRAHQVDVLTIGQYLRPSAHNLPVVRYWTPEEFRSLQAEGMALGFKWVESAPLVRSSYHADVQAAELTHPG